MRKFLALMLSLAFLTSSAAFVYADDKESALNDTGILLFVSPDGDDSASGEKEEPLKTLEGARDRIRIIKKESGYPEKGITVVFRGGTYYIRETVKFSEEDSGTKEAPVKYMAYPGEVPVFEGGLKIPGKEFKLVEDKDVLKKFSKKTQKQVYQLNLRRYLKRQGIEDTTDYIAANTGADNYDFWGTKNGKFAPEDNDNRVSPQPVYAFDNSEALWVARYPNREGGVMPEKYPETRFINTTSRIKAADSVTYQYDDDVIDKYVGYDGVYAYFNQKYRHDWMKINILENGKIKTNVLDSGENSRAEGTRFYIYNILEELDAPGEYYIDDETGMFYVYPNVENISESNLNVPVIKDDYMIKLTNTSYMTFDGIVLENSFSSGILSDGGDFVEIKNCTIENMGIFAVKIGLYRDRAWCFDGAPAINGKNYGINFIDYEGEPEYYPDALWNYWNYDERAEVKGTNSGIDGCFISNTGAESVTLIGGNVYKDENCNHYVKNSVIYYPGLYVTTYSGAILVDGCGFLVQNNELAFNGGRIAGSWGAVSNFTFDRNDVYCANTESLDMGMLYMSYIQPNWGSKITNNYWHDMPFDTEIKNSKSDKGMRSAVYFDNKALGFGVKITGNVFANIPMAFWEMKYTNDYSDNLFVDVYNALPNANLSWAGYECFKYEDFEDYASKTDIAETYLVLRFNPYFAKDEGIRTAYKNEWSRRYPEFIEFMDILTQGKNPEGKFYAKITDNLILNKNMIKADSNIDYNNYDMYDGKALNNEGRNNIFTDDSSVVNDFKNGDYSITDYAKEKYGCDSIDISEVGPQKRVGAKETETGSLPVAEKEGYRTENIITPSENVSIPDLFDSALILKIGKKVEISNGEVYNHSDIDDFGVPIINNSKTLVPVRLISEYFGADVKWDEETKTVTVEYAGKTVTILADIDRLIVDGMVVKVMEEPARIINNRTMIPLRDLMEVVLEKTVYWDERGIIVITDNETVNPKRDINLMNEIADVFERYE